MEQPRCPHQLPPRRAVDPTTDKSYESLAMCSETDKYCLLETGDECEVYSEFLTTSM